MSASKLRIYNTLTRSKEDFVPIDPNNVRMYVCGPTVYDFAHIGNARPAIVFDVLFRLLRHLYGEDHVTYVRNITDVDDKINARALRDFGGEIEAGKLSLNEAIRRVTETTNAQYQKDVTALGCLAPTFQPRATEFVERTDGKTDMIGLIQSLIERGHAYEAAGEVLFDTASMKDYGQLSKRPLDEQVAGARVEVDRHKKNPQDFVLWKLSSPEEPGWPSPWGQEAWTAAGWTGKPKGRPGWHIECSAMSAAYLGEVFDIHGGGLDLIFPHHENEIAQSRCAFGHDVMANYWMHNGFLQVEGRKMAKSDGNFITIQELLETDKFGGRKWPGEVLRLAMLMTHYREPIDFSVRRLEEAAAKLGGWWTIVDQLTLQEIVGPPSRELVTILGDDVNTPGAVSFLTSQGAGARSSYQSTIQFGRDVAFLGQAIYLAQERYDLTADQWTQKHLGFDDSVAASYAIDSRIKEMTAISRGVESGVILEKISLRQFAIAAKDWPSADRIRDELLAQGIQLKDGKDPDTGERVTTWEVKR